MSSFLVDFATDGSVRRWPAYEASATVDKYMDFTDVAKVDTLAQAKAAAWAKYWAT